MNLTTILGAKKDAYARRQGDFVLSQDTAVAMGDSTDVFAYLTGPCQGLFLRIVYRCLDGQVRDIIGRSGVFASEQDGEVQGIGHSMRDYDRLNLSFWTGTFGGKVNTGAGKGYRTLKASGILAIRVHKGGAKLDIVTAAGGKAILQARAGR